MASIRSSRPCTWSVDEGTLSDPPPRTKDQREKRRAYERAGVKEYWVVKPLSQSVDVYCINEQGEFNLPEYYDNTDVISLGVLEDITIDLTRIFPPEEETE